jgi:hypothetical protein
LRAFVIRWFDLLVADRSLFQGSDCMGKAIALPIEQTLMKSPKRMVKVWL